MIKIIGATHQGNRNHNEDCFVANTDIGLGLVADGMGGYACGEVASDLVSRIVEEAVGNNEGLREAIARAHAVVKAAANNDPNKQGMGSTVLALKADGLDYQLAWVGDSRAYLWDSSGMLKQITCDHSYVENLIREGVISEQEALSHPQKHLITQAVGSTVHGGLKIDLVTGRLGAGQTLILCSDGLVDEVSDSTIAQLVAEAVNPQQLLDHLVDAALAAGGRDNITVVVATPECESLNVTATLEPEAVRVTYFDGCNNTGLNSDRRYKNGSELVDKNSEPWITFNCIVWVKKQIKKITGH